MTRLRPFSADGCIGSGPPIVVQFAPSEVEGPPVSRRVKDLCGDRCRFLAFGNQLFQLWDAVVPFNQGGHSSKTSHRLAVEIPDATGNRSIVAIQQVRSLV